MKNIGSIGTTALPILGSFLLMGAASSTFLGDSDEMSEYPTDILNDTLDEVLEQV